MRPHPRAYPIVLRLQFAPSFGIGSTRLEALGNPGGVYYRHDRSTLLLVASFKSQNVSARTLTYSSATQSTLSAGLRELESLIGITLVERTRRVVRFTPLGLRIADDSAEPEPQRHHSHVTSI